MSRSADLSESVREQAMAWAVRFAKRLSGPPMHPITVGFLASELEPLLAAKAEAEKERDARREAKCGNCGEYIVFGLGPLGDERDRAWQVADALAGALKKAQQWAAGFPLQGPRHDATEADRRASDDVYDTANETLKVYSEAKKR